MSHQNDKNPSRIVEYLAFGLVIVIAVFLAIVADAAIVMVAGF